jgi:hypothetical protein
VIREAGTGWSPLRATSNIRKRFQERSRAEPSTPNGTSAAFKLFVDKIRRQVEASLVERSLSVQHSRLTIRGRLGVLRWIEALFFAA